MFDCRQRLCLLLLWTGVGVISPPVFGQLEGKIATQPVAVGYVRDVNQRRSLEYVRNLSERLDFAQEMMQQINADQLEEMESSVEQALSGTTWYMVQGLLPSFKNVSFTRVTNGTEASSMLKARAKLFGSNSKLENGPEDCFKLMTSNSWTQPIPKGQDPQQFLESRTQGVSNVNMSYALDEENGKPVLRQTWSRTEYMRYANEMLYQSDFEELWEMTLPTPETLTQQVREENDMGVTAWFDRIPMGIRQLGWNMLNSTASTQLQQRDEEDPADANLRKFSGEFGLEAVRAILFDVDEASGWLRFATEDEQSVRGDLLFQARRNSQLTQQLSELSAASSRFAAVLNDEAAASVHVCVQLPESADPVLNSAADWIVSQIARSTENDSVMIAAAEQIASTLRGMLNHRVVEAIWKAGWSEPSGGVIYGGIRVDDNPQLLTALYDMVTHAPQVPAAVADAVSLSEEDGLPVMTVELPSDLVNAIEKSSSMKITHLYLTHQNECLWFVAGGRNAVQMLQQCVERSLQSGLAARTSLFSLHVDVQRWLDYPQDDESRIPALLLWLDAHDPSFPYSPISMAFGARSQNRKPTPLLQRVLDLGGEQDVHFAVTTDSDGVRLRLKIGEPIAHYYVARMMDFQNQNMRAQLEEATKKAKEQQSTEQ